MNTIRIYGIAPESIVDGPGIRYAIFTQGCPHRCPGCHNPASHDFAGGYDRAIADMLAEIRANPLLDGVTLSGGEPLCQAAELLLLCRDVHKLGLTVVVYTGYTMEEIRAGQPAGALELLPYADMLIDGRFESDRRDLTLRFRGSANQRIWEKSGEQWRVTHELP